MSRAGQITRRAFLVGSVAVAGGVAFGVYKLRQPIPNPLRPDSGTAMNAFVIIDQNGITAVTGRAEMGQGVSTTLAAMVAEELDVDWEQVRVIHGPASGAYYNGGAFAEAVPQADYERADWLRTVGEALAIIGKPLELQMTGGSTSIRDGMSKLPYAAASAREALRQVAADRLGVSPDTLRTESGAVVAEDGTRIAYADLAEEAAAIDAPQVDPRPQSQWRLLGRSLPRLDMMAKATGTAEYGIDVRLPGMKFASVRMAARPGATMEGFDPAPALEIAGVEQVIDLGDGIAVVASNTWAAIEGARAASIDWGPVPGPQTLNEAYDAIIAGFESGGDTALRDEGDVDAVTGGTVVEAEYRLPYLSHASMEPLNATALVEGEHLTLWSPNQSPVLQRNAVAAAVGLESDAVTVHTPFLGGGFGRRAETDFSIYAARVAAAMPGTPVQVTWSREEDMTHDYYRPATVARARGVVVDGQAVAMDLRIAGQNLTREISRRLAGFTLPGPDIILQTGAFDQPYAIPNRRVRGYPVELPVPVGQWRSVGSSHNAFFHEVFIDELAVAAGRDPMAFRLDLVRPESAVAAGCLEAVREMSGWDSERPDGTGLGVALCWSFGTPVAQVIEVVDEDGRIRIARGWIACDVGTALDPGIIRAQMEGGMLYGLSAAVHQQITFAQGAVEQQNFPDFDALRMSGAPRLETRILTTNPHMGGVGEPGTPPAAPALVNALFALTGRRARELPLDRQFDFVL